MNEKLKNLWRKKLTLTQLLLAWLGLMGVTLVVCLPLLLICGSPFSDALKFSGPVILVVGGGTLSLAGWLFLRWLCCWRNFIRFVFGMACLMTLIALIFTEENWRTKHNWEQFRREWEAKGEKFDLKDCVPPPVPDDQNFALTPVVASCYGQVLTRDGKAIPAQQRDTNLVNRLDFNLGIDAVKPNPLGYWMNGTLSDLKPIQKCYHDPVTKPNLFPVAKTPQTPAQDVLLALSRYDSTLEELRLAGQLTCSRFPLDYGTECPANILLPHLSSMKNVGRVLQLRAIAELENNQSEKALADLKLALRVIEAIRPEPFLISHLVRIASLQIALQPIYEGLAEHRWSESQLIALDAELAKMDFLADYQLSMRGELQFQGGIYEYMRSHRDQIDSFATEFSQTPPAFPTRLAVKMIPDCVFYQNRLRSARCMLDFLIPLADLKKRTVSPSEAQHGSTVFEQETKVITPYTVFERMLVPALGTIVKKFAQAQSSVDLARTAIALERYRLARGGYPESLDALSPQFIAQVPHDVIGGQPLKYRRESDGQFVLYSVGWNEKDDEGEVALKKNSSSVDPDQGDWVWRYPKKG